MFTQHFMGKSTVASCCCSRLCVRTTSIQDWVSLQRVMGRTTSRSVLTSWPSASASLLFWSVGTAQYFAVQSKHEPLELMTGYWSSPNVVFQRNWTSSHPSSLTFSWPRMLWLTSPSSTHLWPTLQVNLTKWIGTIFNARLTNIYKMESSENQFQQFVCSDFTHRVLTRSDRRVAPKLQVLQHVGVACGCDPLLRGHVRHQLVGRAGHSAHRPRPLHLRLLQEAWWKKKKTQKKIKHKSRS